MQRSLELFKQHSCDSCDSCDRFLAAGAFKHMSTTYCRFCVERRTGMLFPAPQKPY